jgi:hypothetical protein
MKTVEHHDNGETKPKTRTLKKEGRRIRWRQEDTLDRALEDTFPCSDPLSSLQAD